MEAKDKSKTQKVKFKATIQVPPLYAVAGGLFLLSLIGFYMFFINLTHMIEDIGGYEVAIMVLGIIFAAACLVVGFIVLGIAKGRKSPPVTIYFDSRRFIRISGANFSVQFQLPVTLMLWATSLGDASAGSTTGLGWTTFGIGFLTLGIASYGFYSLASKPREQLPTAEQDQPPIP